MNHPSQKHDDFETIIYHQKLAHKAWLNKVFLRGSRPSPEAIELVWELLITFSEAVANFDLASEDIYKTAYELAARELATFPVNRLQTVYRDYLLEAMCDFMPDGHPGYARAMIRFANVVSSAFCEASTDQLRKSMRHRRAEVLSSELRMAKRIQSHLLPKVIPDIPGFDFAGRLVPAEEIGGDYWSIKQKSDGGIVTLKLADITGHGVAAATLVAAVKFISGGYYTGASSAAEVMAKTNRVLTLETPHDILVSMVYAWLRPATFEISIVNAGHSPVFLCSKLLCTDISPTGPVLGVTENSRL